MEQPQGYVDVIREDGRVVPLTIETHTIIDREILAKNITTNLGRNLPRFVNRAGLGQVKSGPIAIVGAGPSLKETVNRVRDFENVLVCGSGHDFLVRQGIIPNYAAVCDGGKDDKGNLSIPNKETAYLIASQCDPSLFDHLADYHVEMWHYRGQATKTLGEEAELLKGELSIAWGSSIGMIAIPLARLIGFQHLHFFGFDSCYGRFGMDHHCCKIAGSMEYEKKPVTVGDQTFITDLALIEQASQFFRYIENQYEYFHATIHGDGLIAAMIRHGEPGLKNFLSLA